MGKKPKKVRVGPSGRLIEMEPWPRTPSTESEESEQGGAGVPGGVPVDVNIEHIDIEEEDSDVEGAAEGEEVGVDIALAWGDLGEGGDMAEASEAPEDVIEVDAGVEGDVAVAAVVPVGIDAIDGVEGAGDNPQLQNQPRRRHLSLDRLSYPRAWRCWRRCQRCVWWAIVRARYRLRPRHRRQRRD